MTKKIFGIILSLVFIFSMLPVFGGVALAADPTTSITVTKYAPDGTTVLSQVTLDLAALQALPVQGDGSTHYYMQGPTFDNVSFETMWDPGETVNLKDKGAIMGTDVKDLCEAAGGAVDGDQIQIKASDGYGERFTWDDVYNPSPEQGKFVIAWYTKNSGESSSTYPDGAYVPDFAEGMQLCFVGDVTNPDGKYVFGHWDMHETLPEDNWHYYYDGSIQYPSANGLSIKYINQINIYTQAASQWTVNVTGIMNSVVDQGWFENSLACHETASWTDGSGNVWSGLPLWYVCGLADDTMYHGPGAFNDAVAAAGYTVQVVGGGDYARTFASAAVARSNGYILANLKNGEVLSEDDGYPLKLVGDAITTGADRVKNIAGINLLDVPVIQTWTIQLSGATEYTMSQTEFESGVNCEHSATFTNTDGEYSGMPLWFLVGWVDDSIQHGPGAFNDALAAAGYMVKVTAADGYSYTFTSTDVANNNGIIVANKLNGDYLPDSSYPLRLTGDGYPGSGGWQVRKIASIELIGLPAPTYTLTSNIVGSGAVVKNPDQATYNEGTTVELTATPAAGWDFAGWTGDITGTANPVTVTMDANKTVTATFTQQQWSLQLNGMTQLTISQTDFEAAAAAYPLSWTDGSGNIWTGVALWRLIGKVDDGDANTMNADYAALNYNIAIVASDSYSKTFTSTLVLNNDNMIIANLMNGAPLPQTGSKPPYPLRLVGPGLTSGQMVSKIAKIEFAIPWTVNIVGVTATTMTNSQFESAAAANPASWIDGANTWDGIALWRLVALVDDADPATFNDALAAAGYTVKITATDNYSKTFAIADIARNDGKIIASKYNGYWLPPNRFPIRFVGSGLTSGQMVSKIGKIELLNMPNVITASADANGTITPSGSVAVPYGADQTFTITPHTGYHVADVLVDGASVGAVTTYTFTAVTAAHTISASFAIATFVINATAGANGAIAPAGDVIVNYGCDQTFAITPNPGCQISDVLVDGVSVGPVTTYAFTGVTAAHTISASFVKLFDRFQIQNMTIDFMRRTDTDTIFMKAAIAMPSGVGFNPAADAVKLDIDGYTLNIPAGSFRPQGYGSQTYTYITRGFAEPVVNMTLNLRRGELTVSIRRANVDVINAYDGVTITVTVGAVYGTQTINMFIDSLTYPFQR